MYEWESDYFRCSWKELKANFKQESWKVNLVQKWIIFMKMLFQYTDNPERELKLRNVELLRQWTRWFFFENYVVDNRKVCKNRNTRRQQERNLVRKNVKI